MLRRVLEAAAQLVCVAALAVIVVEREGRGVQKKDEALQAIGQFKELWLSSQSAPPGWLATVLFSDIVLGWLINRLVAAAHSQGLFASMAKTGSV